LWKPCQDERGNYFKNCLVNNNVAIVTNKSTYHQYSENKKAKDSAGFHQEDGPQQTLHCFAFGGMDQSKLPKTDEHFILSTKVRCREDR